MAHLAPRDDAALPATRAAARAHLALPVGAAMTREQVGEVVDAEPGHPREQVDVQHVAEDGGGALAAVDDDGHVAQGQAGRGGERSGGHDEVGHDLQKIVPSGRRSSALHRLGSRLPGA
jgi:hypothetical protein